MSSYEGFAARIERTGTGDGHKVERPSIHTGRIETRNFEVEAGPDGRLSRRRSEREEKLGKDYIERRVELPPFMHKDVW